MQITLNHDEILEALDAYVRTQIAIAPGQQVTIDLKAGRGENGFSATLDIVPVSRKTSVSEERMAAAYCEPDAPVETPKATGNTINPVKPAALSAPKASPFGKPKAVEKALEPEVEVGTPEEATEPTQEAQEEDPAPEIPNEDDTAPAAADEAPAPAANPRSIFSKIKTA